MRRLVFVVAVLAVACGGDGATSSVPEGVPEGVPLPAGLEVEVAEEHVGVSSTIHEVTGWYDGDPVQAARAYESVLEGLGYEITSRSESTTNSYFVAENDIWYVSAGFFPDPIRNEGTSVGITIAPAS